MAQLIAKKARGARLINGNCKIWHESREIHAQADASIIFEVEVAGTDEIKFWIMSWGPNALVLEPESLRDELRIEAELLLNRYEKEGDKEEKVGI